jgi:hypothetical protein
MEDIEYKLEAVEATQVPSEEIDQTFRSSCIGPSTFVSFLRQPCSLC